MLISVCLTMLFFQSFATDKWRIRYHIDYHTKRQATWLTKCASRMELRTSQTVIFFGEDLVLCNVQKNILPVQLLMHVLLNIVRNNVLTRLNKEPLKSEFLLNKIVKCYKL